LYAAALSVSSEAGISFCDAPIVSSTAAAGCGLLLTEDLQHGRRIRGMEIRNPFLPA
jgi:predicted nucleic acid-binding protein